MPGCDASPAYCEVDHVTDWKVHPKNLRRRRRPDLQPRTPTPQEPGLDREDDQRRPRLARPTLARPPPAVPHPRTPPHPPHPQRTPPPSGVVRASRRPGDVRPGHDSMCGRAPRRHGATVPAWASPALARRRRRGRYRADVSMPRRSIGFFAARNSLRTRPRWPSTSGDAARSCPKAISAASAQGRRRLATTTSALPSTTPPGWPYTEIHDDERAANVSGHVLEA